ncbi:hypothetical protein BO70DRAFT_20807 [Aspergillus heteromorphus CBS 117.55]|uniref:Uncharacterized protein n=1 Tax=Aspergillus heteromorphus CBS 117.55 TaxID=1448321 RepID=A0A317X2M0_9EURO|nr:uncharacterized protein BO70DRAFT_20807 [Aspergillus heteromorphus CBS 117.55]PWY92884.1 hypothetical protein BO70DRAFT_20807 [Aspergillus heteromorphus CBS 117.55]
MTVRRGKGSFKRRRRVYEALRSKQVQIAKRGWNVDAGPQVLLAAIREAGGYWSHATAWCGPRISSRLQQSSRKDVRLQQKRAVTGGLDGCDRGNRKAEGRGAKPNK